jgi:CheY-like chemotaxis protein
MQIPAADIGVKQRKARPSGPRARKENRTAPLSVKGRVLVMEDDVHVRIIIRSMLRDLGYGACIARDGEKAIKKFQAAKDLQRPFDMVILDLVIPVGMEGHEVLERLRVMDPGIKAILLTGDINHQALAHYTERGFQAVLLKPFMRYELSRTLELAAGG